MLLGLLMHKGCGPAKKRFRDVIQASRQTADMLLPNAQSRETASSGTTMSLSVTRHIRGLDDHTRRHYGQSRRYKPCTGVIVGYHFGSVMAKATH